MTATLTHRYLAEYARRPINLILLVVVPVVFVALSAGVVADFAKLLGADGEGAALESVTAGWAAAFLAGMAGFFHVGSSRNADRRLALAGMNTRRILAARLASGLVLALVAAGGALAALAFRTGIADVPRTLGATVMFAVVYLGIGAAVGAAVRDEVNGSLVVLFVWLLDVFLGPAMGRTDAFLTRLFPTHFVTLVMTDAATGHAGSLGDLGAALAWTSGAIGLAAAIFGITTRPTRGRARAAGPGGISRLAAGLRYGLREYRRNLTLWVLLITVPVVLITLSFAVTPDAPTPVESGAATTVVSMVDLHGAIMVPITVGFLAGLAGLFVVLGSAQADRRLVLAGFRPAEVLGARLGIVTLAAVLTTAVSLGVTAVDFRPAAWVPFVGASLLVALTYAMIGVLVGPMVGRLGGLFVMFLVPMIDVGIAQNAMFGATLPSWATYLPAHGAVRMLLDGAFTQGFSETGGLLLALAWLAAITAVAALVFHRVAEPQRA
ncbi:MAG TPA: ABC transporter permease [Actinomycetota bacterium]